MRDAVNLRLRKDGRMAVRCGKQKIQTEEMGTLGLLLMESLKIPDVIMETRLTLSL